MPLSALLKRKFAGLRSPRNTNARQPETTFSLNAVLGFSLIGLLVTLIVSGLPLQEGTVGLVVILAIGAAPIAAWLGFTLGSPD